MTVTDTPPTGITPDDPAAPDHVIEGLDYEPDITGEPTGGFELPYNDLYDEDGDLVDWEPDPGPGD